VATNHCRNLTVQQYIEFGLKHMGEVLIDTAFTDINDETKKKYKNYNVKVSFKDLKSRLGKYNSKTNIVEVSSVRTQPRGIVLIVFIHELSHHIDFINTGSLDHQQGFYDIHIKLLKKAIDLDIITPDDIEKYKQCDASNHNKIENLMNGYEKKGVVKISDYMNTSFFEYLPEDIEIEKHIKVKSDIKDKDLFKERKYRWNSDLLVWEKQVKSTSRLCEEQKFLEENGYKKLTIDTETYYTKKVKIHLTGNTYRNKETIANWGYFYSEKQWYKTVSSKDVFREISRIRRLKGVLVTCEF
jgi:hypothetical protein